LCDDVRLRRYESRTRTTGLVADTFAAPTRALLHDLPARWLSIRHRHGLRNAATWGGEADLVDALQAIERTNRADTVMWEPRQTVWIKTAD
jgi:hypothetical protein